MRVLILGGAGMLGHKLFQVFQGRFETFASFRAMGAWASYPVYADVDRTSLLVDVDATAFETVVRALARCRPNVVVNCIGIVKQLRAAEDPIACLTVNALFPHRLADLCAASGARLVHISTDCVFNGRRGGYVEDDVTDAEDLYGRSKLLGEVAGPHCLTLRTSIVGRDFQRGYGLLEWFLGQRGGAVRGFRNAIFSGLTTQALAHTIANVIQEHAQLAGLYQVASEPISKYELLVKIRDALGLDIGVEPHDGPRIDRSMSAARFVAATGRQLPSWDRMIADLAADPTPYDAWRAQQQEAGR